jgi:hypothetical protein
MRSLLQSASGRCAASALPLAVDNLIPYEQAASDLSIHGY